MSVTVALAPDAAFALGIASTAMPFARSREDEMEHWLRIMRLSGDAGSALQSLGVGEGRLDGLSAEPQERDTSTEHDVVAVVASEALRVADERLSAVLTTTDLLIAVMEVYGSAFDRVLEAHGVTRDDVAERLRAA